MMETGNMESNVDMEKSIFGMEVYIKVTGKIISDMESVLACTKMGVPFEEFGSGGENQEKPFREILMGTNIQFLDRMAVTRIKKKKGTLKDRNGIKHEETSMEKKTQGMNVARSSSLSFYPKYDLKQFILSYLDESKL